MHRVQFLKENVLTKEDPNNLRAINHLYGTAQNHVIEGVLNNEGVKNIFRINPEEKKEYTKLEFECSEKLEKINLSGSS